MWTLETTSRPPAIDVSGFCLPRASGFDLLIFSLRPENLEKSSIVSIASVADLRELTNNVVSSANLLILNSVALILTPSISGLDLIINAISSTDGMKRRGERQHHCLTPLIGPKYSEENPALRTQVSGPRNKVLMESMKLSPNPKRCSALRIKGQLTESNAFR